MTSFSIKDFTSDIRTRGVIRSHSFMVWITPPLSLRKEFGDGSKIIIRCDGANLPSSSLLKSELFRYGFGLQESAPYGVQFEPINLSFIMDSQGQIYDFFYKWMNSVVNYRVDSRAGINGRTNGMLPFEVGYKSSYQTIMRLFVFNENADTAIEVTLLDAYPTSLSDIPFNWSQTDEIVRLNVPIYYRDFFVNVMKAEQLREVNNILSATVAPQNINRPPVRDTLNSQNLGPFTPSDFQRMTQFKIIA